MMFVNPVVFFFFSCFLQRTLVGLVRDLRGIAFAFNAKTSFMMLFDWMYPFSRDTVRLLTARWTVIIFIIHQSVWERSWAQTCRYPAYMPILQRAIELWYHDPACTTPVLKLMAELVHNRWAQWSRCFLQRFLYLRCLKPSDTVKDVNRFKSELSNHHHHNNFCYCSLVHFGHSEWKSAIFIIE